MPKSLAALALVLFFSACASAPPPPVKVAPPPVVAEPSDNGTPPGMIPASCEALLQKSEEWGYKPGEKWKPASPAQALEVADFFASFTLVPEPTSRALHTWMNSSASSTPLEAKDAMKKIEAMQFCDHTLAMVFLEAILKYQWPRAAKAQAARDFSQFILNQQSRASLLESRAVTIHVLKNAREKHLLPGSTTNVAKLRIEIQKAKAALAPVQIAESEPSDLDTEKSLRKELAFSENIRERLAREIPLP
ncbi:MAG: hypothetical protein ACXWQO_17770 [Bdellovibrionota bacterium]